MKRLLPLLIILALPALAHATPTPTPTATATPAAVGVGRERGGTLPTAPIPIASPSTHLPWLVRSYVSGGRGSDPASHQPDPSVFVNPLFTLTGATPTLSCTVSVGIYDTNYEVLTGNVTAVTTPANGVCPKGKIIHAQFQQSLSGGPFTVVAIASWTAGE